VSGERQVAAADWPAAIAAAVADGWRFADLHDAPGDRLRALLLRGAEQRLLCCAGAGRRVGSLIERLPAAIWDEREAHERGGWRFAGHEPLRPLLGHDAPAWARDEGVDLHQVAVGPIHAGVIESGHFRFHCVGERILELELRLFYKHRGLEREAVGRPLASAIVYAQRACGADAVANQVAYAQACEAALGLAPPPALRRARTLLLELERLYNHLNDISAVCAGVGFAPGTMLFAALKERAQRLCAELTGHRFLFGTVAVGASRLAIGAAAARAALAELGELRRAIDAGWHELRAAGSLQDRLVGLAVLTRADALALGAVGPAARASGVDEDVRGASPLLDYAGFVAASPGEPSGDVAARVRMRAAELGPCLDVLERLLDAPPAPAQAEREREPAAVGAGVVESPRGRSVCVVERAGERLARLRLRSGSYANWPALTRCVRGILLPDFPLVNKSFELCYACVDR